MGLQVRGLAAIGVCFGKLRGEGLPSRWEWFGWWLVLFAGHVVSVWLASWPNAVYIAMREVRQRTVAVGVGMVEAWEIVAILDGRMRRLQLLLVQLEHLLMSWVAEGDCTVVIRVSCIG